MLVLAFDTSTTQGAVGWIDAPRAAPVERIDGFAESVMPARPGHAETLIGRIEATLEAGGFALDQVELIVFGRGPGSFTGLRIGLSTAKGLALARGVPIVGLSSLESLALSAGLDGLVAPVVDARRGEIFTAVYEVGRNKGRPFARSVVAEQVLPPAGFAELLAQAKIANSVSLIGDGTARYREELGAHGVIQIGRFAAPSAVEMAITGLERFLAHGGDDPATVEPVYLREPDARLPQNG
jgi:tRNA threonylcarbamoyl adenosine modification protein YeaZ